MGNRGHRRRRHRCCQPDIYWGGREKTRGRKSNEHMNQNQIKQETKSRNINPKIMNQNDQNFLGGVM